jgi:hypothetical protein
VPWKPSGGSSAEVLCLSVGFDVGSNGDVSPDMFEESFVVASGAMTRRCQDHKGEEVREMMLGRKRER